MIDEMFDAGTPSRQQMLRPIRPHLLAQAPARTVVSWARRSAVAELVRRMLIEGLDVTHEALDAVEFTHTARTLRRVWMDAGVLEQQFDQWEEFDRWLADFLRDRPSHIARELAAYCRWELVPRLRLTVGRNGVRTGTFTRARRSCRVTLAFLEFLDERGTRLFDADQSAVEDYLALHPGQLDAVSPFVRWAREAGRSRRLQPPGSRWGSPRTHYSESEHREWLERFSTDETLSLRVRICGLLCGIAGRPTSVIATLRRSQIIETSDGLRIQIGKAPISIREPLASLLRQQLAAERSWSGSISDETDWLFPARLSPGRPTRPELFTNDLRKIGCSVLRLRGAAMLNLAATVPVGALIDVTGTSSNQAVR